MKNIMDDRVIVQKEKGLFIKLIASILIVSIVLISRTLIKSKLISNDMELIIAFIETFGLIFSILACTSFLISYKRLKNDSVFIISLMYLSLAISISVQYINAFSTYNNRFIYYNFDTVTSWLLKSLLIVIALLPKNKIKSMIVNNKVKSILFIFLYMICNTYICRYFNLYTNENFFRFINIVLIIVYFIAAIVFFLTGVKDKEYLYIVISSSMLILSIKTICVLINLNVSSLYKVIILSGLGYLVLLTIISGSFIELILYVNRVRRLNENLNMFYKLSNNNKHSFLFMCTKDGEVLYANEKFEKNYRNLDSKFNFNEGYGEALKYPFKVLRPITEINEIKNALNTSGQWRGVLRVNDNNTYIDCSLQLINPLDNDSLISVSYMDISDIINKELEVEKLKVYNREQTEFISNISHELRTPIHIFSSTIQLLDKFSNQNIYDFKNVYDRYRNSLDNNCKRMLRLVNNVIDVAKIEKGILKGNLQYYNLISIIEDVTLSVQYYAELKSIDIHFDTNCEEFISKCDCSMIERTILNLLSNAIKFTDKNKNIYVNIFGHDDYIDIHIKDEGKGIPKKDMDHIFKRFVQSDKSLTRENEGSGIGLSIVKSIVDLHEGHITVNSEEGIGTTFKIILPQIGDTSNECNVFGVSDYNTELELSDIYELLY